MSLESVTILGGGVVGLTTAITLCELGVKVILVSEVLVFKDNQILQPLIPTFYAGGMLYPDDLIFESKELSCKKIVSDSLKLFSFLTKKEFGIFNVQHLVFGDGPERIFPELSQPIEEDNSYPYKAIKFSSLIAEMPIYMKKLWSHFIAIGGKIEQRKITTNRLKDNIVINCLGYGGEEVFLELKDAGILLRGPCFFIKDYPLLRNKAGDRITYQFMPSKHQYYNDSGSGQFLFGYPRHDGIILGGAREPGKMVNGKFVPIWEYPDKFLHQGSEIPRPIVDLNLKIIEECFGKKISLDDGEITTGYRYALKNGAKLGFHNDNLIHSTGYGACGVLYSWGAAIETARLLRGRLKLTKTSSLLSDELLKLL